MLDQNRHKILSLIDQAKTMIPLRLQNELPNKLNPITKEDTGAANWHDFERAIWALGEEIRQITLKYPKLRHDQHVAAGLATIANDPRAARGRQSFITNLGYKAYFPYASQLAMQLPDKNVRGHIISTLYKMQAGQFIKEVNRYVDDEQTWIRNQALEYVKHYGTKNE